MKKCILLFIILIAVLTLTLVAFSCESDKVGQTAKADMGIVLTNMSAPSGVVLPNSLGYDDFSGVQITTFTSPSQFVGADEGLYAHDYILNADSSVTVNGTYQNYFIVFDVVNNDNSYCVLTFSFTQPTNKVHTMRLWSLSTNSQIFTRQLSSSPGNYFSLKPGNINDYSLLQLPTGKYVVYEEGSVNSSYTLYRIKLEKWDSSILYSTSCGFSGFVVPNYTYQPEPSVYDDWDGLVRPNCLNSPDFYNYPVFVESTAITDAYKNMWLSNMDGYVFNYNGPEVLGSLTMNVHDYGQNEDPAFLYYLDNYADSFDFSGVNAHFRLALNSQVPGTVTLTSGGGTSSERFDVGFTFVDVGLSYTQTTSFIAISIVFDRYMGVQNKTCELIYSKLEVGNMFTGYVIPDHEFSSAVKDNLLNNYNFSSVPLTSQSARVGAWWYQYIEGYGGGEHDEYISFSSDYGGLTFDTQYQNSRGTLYLTYAVPASDDFNPVGSYIFTVQLWSRSTIGGAVEFTALDGVNDIRYKSMFASTGGPQEYSFRFPKVNGVILTLAFPVYHGMPNTIYYAKLEEGSFTGFCGNYQEFYDNGYNAGYSDGYSLGSETYGTSLYTLNFDNTSDYTVLDFGWSDMGFADADALYASTMSFEYIGFYRSLGYAIATQISVDVPSSSLRRLYASADINFNLSNISVAQDYVMLEIMENSSRLVIVNAQYPNDYTPEVYPDYRVVRVNVQRGLSNILDAYGDSRFEQGRLAGYDQGYSQGEADGERRGYSQATQVAMNGTGGWFGFISAFIDVPVKALTSLLDFDFFGFNLLNLVKILLVFSLVYLVIRLITKGKVAS